MPDEGVIRFDCRWTDALPTSHRSAAELIVWRDRLFEARLVGQDADGFGYGNVSVRSGHSGQFVITGSQTGGIPRLSRYDLTEVTAADIACNVVKCRGPVRASSESLTHAACYQADPGIGAVAHVHDHTMWERLRDVAPTTCPELEYGTPALALDILRLIAANAAPASSGIVVMAGHADGLIAYGPDIETAASSLLALRAQYEA